MCTCAHIGIKALHPLVLRSIAPLAPYHESRAYRVHSTPARTAPEVPAGYLPIGDQNIPELPPIRGGGGGVGLSRSRQTNAASTSTNQATSLTTALTSTGRNVCKTYTPHPTDHATKPGLVRVLQSGVPSRPRQFTLFTWRLVKYVLCQSSSPLIFTSN